MKFAAALIVLVLGSGVCQAVETPVFAIYEMKELRSNSNPSGKWTVNALAQPGGPYVFKGKNGLTLVSSKDTQRILRGIVKAQTNAPIISSRDLAEKAKIGSGKLPTIELALTPAASARFAKFTQSHVGVFLGAFIDGRLVSLARVMETIRNGRIQIGGIKSLQETERVVAKINDSSAHAPKATAPSKVTPPLQTSSLVTPKGKDTTHRFGEFPYVEKRAKGFTQVYGTIGGSVRWTKAKSPYVITENVYVDRDACLTIDPGVTAKFTKKSGGNIYDGQYSLWVMGRLQAEGTPKERITFTSASASPQQAMEWGSIELNSFQPNILTWAVVRYGGSLWVQGCALIAHCTVEHCHSAIWVRDSAVVEVRNNVCVDSAYSGIRSQSTLQYCMMTDNILWKNGDGIESWGGAKAYLNHNLVFGNRTDYLAFAVPGTNDVQLSPVFVDASASDYRLAADSPARGAGTDGADIGLCQDKWTPETALREKKKFLDNGALALWLQALSSRFDGRANPIESSEEALRKASEPLLRDRITCYLADLYRRNRQPGRATELLNHVLQTSTLPHFRDLARGILAQLYADERSPEKAIAILRQVEWPQSKVWIDVDLPKYLVMVGNTDEALALLRKTPKVESYQYLRSLVEIVDSAVAANRLDAAKAALAGIEEYPICPQAVQMRLHVAYALRDAKRYEEALALLQENDSKDPLSRDAPENLFAMAALLEENLNKPDEANQVRVRLVTDYYPENQFVKRARDAVRGTIPSEDKSRFILLDESQQESSVFDRSEAGNCGFGQWIGTQVLRAKGFHVHTNGNTNGNWGARTLDPQVMAQYGLLIMHGRYGAIDYPPMPQDVIENLVNYVNDGGVLMVFACGTRLGSGREAQYYNPLIKRFGMSFAEGVDLPESRTPARALLPGRLDEPVEFTPVGGVEVRPGKGEVLARSGALPVAAGARFGKGWVVAVGSGSGFLDGNLEGRDNVETAGRNKSAYASLVEYAASLRSSQASD